MLHYPRPALACEIADSMAGKLLLGDGQNGVFLAAPRRTGKSTFLQLDLKPELERRGIVTVYVDLWADQARDPARLIADAIGGALHEHLGPVARMARNAGVENVNVAGALKVDTSKIGRMDGLTLPDALRKLHETAKAPIALIIDEAQHALTSQEGDKVMAALKSARDQMNRPGVPTLMIVMSGSDRDKLLRLVNSNAAPFYGSTISKMQPLGPDYVEFVAGQIEGTRPDLAPVNRGTLVAAFEIFGFRPQFFVAAIGEALNPLIARAGRFEDRVMERAIERRDDDERQMEADYLALKPLEQAVLWRLLERAGMQRFRPYDAESLAFYAEKTGLPVSAQQAQNALEGLRERSPSLVWKSSRGEYAVDDAAMHRWYAARLGAGTWPPFGLAPATQLNLPEIP